ncbi:AGAMOUS-like 46 [Raphanus sativus]|uniref:Agamous-like MADS-box protein AGL80 n=1 Tax=Raphanus sativus TaxID=3726 RepID=A0A6J0K288_RAPSA|nr:agamous-like MADS-box protein AGL80 [Raphanus sativus]KAJ4886110.1 AGAMOUS-like 46 [Raphanus sativus]
MTGKKLNLAYISNDSVRKRTLNKRKKGLLKKLDELKILCDVDMCAVIYSPYNSTPEVWPSNSEVHKVMEKFEKVPEEERTKRLVNHEEYLIQAITKVKSKIQRLTEDNNDKLMKELMFARLNEDMGDLAIDDSNRGILCEFIDGYLRKVYHHRNVALKDLHLETGESSSMAMAMDMPPIAMAEAGSSSFFNSPQQTNEFQPLVTLNYGPEHISSHGSQSLNVPTFNFSQQTNEVQPTISSNQGVEHVHYLGKNFMSAPIFNSPRLTNELQPLVTSNQGLEHNSSHGSQFLNVPTFKFSQQTNEVQPTISSNQGLEHVYSLGNNFMNAPIFNPPQQTNEIQQPIISSNQEANHVESLASDLFPFSNHGVNTQVMNQDEVHYPLNQQDWHDEEMMKHSQQACFPWMEENNHYNHHQL